MGQESTGHEAGHSAAYEAGQKAVHGDAHRTGQWAYAFTCD